MYNRLRVPTCINVQQDAMASFSGKRNVMVSRPSVSLYFRRILSVTHKGAARDAASVHFCSSITRINILITLCPAT